MMINWDTIQEVMGKVKEKIKSTGIDIPVDMIDSMEKQADSIFNPIEALDAEQVDKYNQLKALKLDLDKEVKEATAFKERMEAKFNKVKTLENFFTSSIELKHDLSNKQWRINEKTSMVEVFDQERALKEMKGMGGFNEMFPTDLFGDNTK